MPDLTRALKLRQRAEGLFQGHSRIHGVQLVHVDSVHTQPAQASLQRLPERLWPGVAPPFARSPAG